ncbi:MAG: hydantoinase B/oxoprolinase family protein [Planctomycetia bacterium]|nr:hydantoinase B/oxoprolinase family protein [Planctomycetia bacterium]
MSPWQFWIDVGGTFTDCFALSPDGRLLRHKLLSSGVTKGSAGDGSKGDRIVDPARGRDPPEFWDGYELRLLDSAGNVTAASRVLSFDRDTGMLVLQTPLSPPPAAGQVYELVSDEGAPVIAVRHFLSLRHGDPIPPVEVRLGTTRGTNALITRRGARTAFVTTKGFADVLLIGYQNRPRLFDLDIKKPEPLFAAMVEIDERLAADGAVLVAPDPAKIRSQLEQLKSQKVESLAICLLHAFAFPRHEELVERTAREAGFQEISVSHRVAPFIKIVSRGDTTVMDAYLNPVLRAYVEQLCASLCRDGAGGNSTVGKLRIMTSAGGLVEASQFVGKDSILSGPAGGVVGFSRVAEAASFRRAIGFDMGGTSTDVSRYDGRHELEFETEKAGVRVVAPMLAIRTVAAGGGSICSFDGVKLVVGPDSAGADPGPACYGRGGPLAVTDLNFYLGKIPADRFPFPLDRRAVEARLAALAAEIEKATGRRLSPVELCDGFVRVANANMVRPIRSISVAKGYDPRDYVLVAFGGAAGQHACAVARELGMRQVLLHPDAGLLSAYGIGMAPVARHMSQGVYQPHSEAAVAGLHDVFTRLEQEGRAEVLAEGIATDKIAVHRSLDLRYQGQEASLSIPEPEIATYADAFAVQHRQLYGYAYEGRALEIVAARVEISGSAAEVSVDAKSPRLRRPEPARTTQTCFDTTWQTCGVFFRESLAPGDVIAGPAIVCEDSSTAVIDPGWQAEVLARGELLLTDVGRDAPRPISTDCDVVLLEVFNNLFAGIAEQMGITLRNTASSVNVKERLDFSCAIFTAAGDLVVNAPHIPVHLGAMGETVRKVLADNPDLQPGDVLVSNDPYHGGSHLPDITVVTPVFVAGRLMFFTASRAHHAEIGGIRPGSMPPFSKNLAEEGVLIRNFALVRGGTSRMEELRKLLLSGRYPTRAVADNLADIAAQVAANRQGERDLLALVERYSPEVVAAYMGHIQAAAETKMRRALQKLPPGKRTFTDHLDDGTPITVTITIDGDRARLDFVGTGPVMAGNLNANRAIVTAAVMYCLRCLIDEDIPLNQGVLAPVEIIVPECLLSPAARQRPEDCPAVVGGNVETSQRVVDVVLGALGLAAASQGTMNNTLFGDASFGYYETICGGAGATPKAAGADAVHTHMTNTRLTDVEVVERRYPVRVLEFSIRRGSGGAGKHRGGDGVIRKIQFLRALEVSLLHQRRGPYPPYGLAGGRPGALGRNTLRRPDGATERLSGLVQFVAQAGDVLVIETPGGGGWGAPS